MWGSLEYISVTQSMAHTQAYIVVQWIVGHFVAFWETQIQSQQIHPHLPSALFVWHPLVQSLHTAVYSLTNPPTASHMTHYLSPSASPPPSCSSCSMPKICHAGVFLSYLLFCLSLEKRQGCPTAAQSFIMFVLFSAAFPST